MSQAADILNDHFFGDMRKVAKASGLGWYPGRSMRDPLGPPRKVWLDGRSRTGFAKGDAEKWKLACRIYKYGSELVAP